MKIALSAVALCFVLSAHLDAFGQKRRTVRQRSRAESARRAPEIGKTGVVMDETLSVLRPEPSLFAVPIQRMRRGRQVKIAGVAESDGVKFYRVLAPPAETGWVQSDAVFGRFRPGDDVRLAKLVRAMDGFDQIEAASEFFRLYPDSEYRPAVLLLFGDLLEEVAAKLTRDSNSRLDRNEMAASGAPLHSFYLNFVSLDRYRRLGIVFLFNSSTRQFHYDGASWSEIVKRFPSSAEVVEAKKRLDLLSQKMEKRSQAGMVSSGRCDRIKS